MVKGAIRLRKELVTQERRTRYPHDCQSYSLYVLIVHNCLNFDKQRYSGIIASEMFCKFGFGVFQLIWSYLYAFCCIVTSTHSFLGVEPGNSLNTTILIRDDKTIPIKFHSITSCYFEIAVVPGAVWNCDLMATSRNLHMKLSGTQNKLFTPQ